MTDTITFKPGDRVRVRAESLDGYKSAFQKFARNRPATVVRLPTADGFTGWPGTVRVEFDTRRKGDTPKREWLHERDLEHVPSDPTGDTP